MKCPLQPQRQQQFLHLAAQGAGVGEEQVLGHLLGDGGAALHAPGRRVRSTQAARAMPIEIDAAVLPEPPVLHRHRRRRQVRRQVGQAQRLADHVAEAWRKSGRCGPAASGWGGARRPAPLPAAAGRGRTTAARTPASERAPDASDERPLQQPPAPAARRLRPGGRGGGGAAGAAARERLRRRACIARFLYAGNRRRCAARKSARMACRSADATAQMRAADTGRMRMKGLFLDAVDDSAACSVASCGRTTRR